jgi:4-amino-4-deoxy-L-arabinose transferase-like glycosyltransferase
MEKKIVIIGILILALMWSIWYMANNPRDFRGSVSKLRCDDQTKKSAYCVGFGEGYNWAFTEMEESTTTNTTNQ